LKSAGASTPLAVSVVLLSLIANRWIALVLHRSILSHAALPVASLPFTAASLIDLSVVTLLLLRLAD
jgi:hypothetical protein